MSLDTFAGLPVRQVVDDLADLLEAAGPGLTRAGRPPADAVTLADFTRTDTVTVALDAASAHFARIRPVAAAERTAAGFTVFYGVVVALLTPPLAALIHPDAEPRLVDPAGTALAFGPDGMLTGYWPALIPTALAPTGGSDGVSSTAMVGAWAAAELAAVVSAFAPALRIGPRSYAAAAGSVVAHRADRMGRRLGELGRARRVVGELISAAAPAIRPVRYERVELGHGSVSTPAGGQCCLWYRLSGGAFCAGCGREPEPGRTEHLRRYLTETVLPAPVPTPAPTSAPAPAGSRGVAT